MAIRKSPIQVGRGNEDHPVAVDIPAVASVFILRIVSGSDSASNFVTNTQLTIPTSGSSSFNASIGQTPDGTSPIQVTIASTDDGNAIRTKIATAFQANSMIASAVATANQAAIVITLDATGPSAIPTIVSQQTGNTNNIPESGFIPGRDLIADEVLQYVFRGPFSNIVPNKDPLQGMARASMLYSDFISDVTQLAGTGTVFQTNLVARVVTLKSILQSTFPEDFLDSGIDRTNAAGKIAIRNSRRGTDGLVGRGNKTIADIFVNETADFGLRQLILRIYDSIADLFDAIADTAATADEIREIARVEFRTFEVEIGELERAIGKSSFIYDNTIINGGTDQGLLIYSDQIAEKLRVLPDTPVIADLQSSFADTERLRLKN